MTARAAGGGGAARPRKGDTEALVRAIGHEIGNLLAGIRLLAHVLGRVDAAAADAAQIEGLAARAGGLVGGLASLVGRGGRRAPCRLAPSDVLAALGRATSGAALEGAREIATPGPLPDVLADPDALHHALLGLLRAAQGAQGRRVRVSALPARGGVAFCVSGGVALPLPTPVRAAGKDAPLPSGAELELLVAERLARRDGGRLRRHALADGAAELRLFLPAAPEGRGPVSGDDATRAGGRAPARPGRRRKPAARAGPTRGRASRGPSARST